MGFTMEKQYPSIDEYFDYYDFESLIQTCEERAKELLTSNEVVKNRNIDFVFWTKNIPELIGIARYREDKLGNISYEFDTTECTL